jgi:hypothetical protein
MIGTVTQAGQRRPQVAHLVVGRPLKGSVVRIAGAGAMVPEVECENVVTDVAEMVEIRQVAPAVAQILVAEDQQAHSLRVAPTEERTREFQPVVRGKCHRLAEILG